MLLKDLVKEFEFDCKVRELTPKTIGNYQKQLSYFLAFLEDAYGITELESLRSVHIKEFINRYQLRGNKPAYINDLLKAVKCLCAYAYREGYTEELITQRVKNVKEPKVLIHTFSNNEVFAMINYFSGNDYLSVRNKLITMMLFDTGIRIAELLDLKPKHIQETYFIIHGKGRKERVVPKNPMISKWLFKYMIVRESYFEDRFAEDYLFLTKNGNKLTNEVVTARLKEAGRAVGVNPNVRVSPHTCRHTFAQMQLRNGLDLYSLSRLMGHESIAITQRYLDSIQDFHVLTAAHKTGVLANLRR